MNSMIDCDHDVIDVDDFCVGCDRLIERPDYDDGDFRRDMQRGF